MNIILIGYRGTGKTVVGEKLSKKLNKKLLGTDNLVIKKAKMPIPKIVKKYGWERFRKLESEVIVEISKMDNCVADTGGGAILRKKNVDNLKKNGTLILLTADVKTIVNRIKDDKQRPSLTGKKSFTEEVEEVLKDRKKKYKDASNYAIDTSNLTVDEVVNKIISYLKTRNRL